MPKRKTPQTAAWQAYWSDNNAPHPDSFAYRQGLQTQQRVLAPFRGKAGEYRTTQMDQRETWYCHHYRLPNEHYHKTQEELEACSD